MDVTSRRAFCSVKLVPLFQQQLYFDLEITTVSAFTSQNKMASSMAVHRMAVRSVNKRALEC